MELLNTIDAQLQEMVALVQAWANINSHSANQAGLDKMVTEAKKAFTLLQPDEIRVVSLAKGSALFLAKRHTAPIQIFLGGHLDTVYSLDQPFQQAVFLDSSTLQGPGVTDMKGGIVVLLYALQVFEKSPEASRVGWRICLNCDEEIGSPYSTPFIETCAEQCHLGCIFEPAFSDGMIVSKRKGSSNYKVISRGKKAHAGRHPEEGKNAIYPLARFIAQAEIFNDLSEGILVNVGVVKGGEASNIIPDYASCDINLRCSHSEILHSVDQALRTLAQKEGLELTQTVYRPPKVFDKATEKLFHQLKRCATLLGIELNWRESGGVCDGNTLAAKGIPTIDTLGVKGGKIHTEEEYLDIPSLSERAKLAALFLQEIARGNIEL